MVEIDGQVTQAPGSTPLAPRLQPGLVGPDTFARGGTLTWTVHGAPGSAGVGVASLGTQGLALPPLLATWLYTAAHPTAVPFGPIVVGATGVDTFSMPVPALQSLAGVHVFVQLVGWLGQPDWKASGVAVTRIL